MRLIAYVKVSNVRSPALISRYNGHLHDLDGPTSGSVTSGHVTICKSSVVCVNYSDIANDFFSGRKRFFRLPHVDLG